MARICWGCSTGCFIYSFAVQVISEKTLCSKGFSSNLRQIRFYPVFALSYKTKTRIRFSAIWWSGNKKYFCFFFVASRALLQSHAEFNRLLKRNFLTSYSCSYYSFMHQSTPLIRIQLMLQIKFISFLKIFLFLLWVFHFFLSKIVFRLKTTFTLVHVIWSR